MTTITPKNLFDPVSLTDSIVSYYTVPKSTSCIIKKLTLCNYSLIVVSVEVYLVNSDEAPSNNNIVLDTIQIAPNQTFDAFELVGHVLQNQQSLQMVASNPGSIAARAAGVEVIG